jgi:hypothetical protein
MNTRSEVLQIIMETSRQQAELNQVSIFLDEVLIELASGPNPPMTGALLFKLTAGTASYTLPGGAFSVCHAFYRDYRLRRTDHRQYENYSSTWRTDTGDPWAYSSDLEALSQAADGFMKFRIRFFPTPTVTSVSGSLPEPLGANYPDYHAVLIYGEKRDTYIPDWIVYYIVFEVLYREFSRPSDHRDVPFALVCKDVASLFKLFMGKYDAA